MAFKHEQAISPLADPSYGDLEDYFEKVIQLNQLEMLYGKHLVDEATYPLPPSSAAPSPEMPIHVVGFISFAPTATRRVLPAC